MPVVRMLIERPERKNPTFAIGMLKRKPIGVATEKIGVRTEQLRPVRSENMVFGGDTVSFANGEMECLAVDAGELAYFALRALPFLQST